MPPSFAFRRSNAVALASHKEHRWSNGLTDICYPCPRACMCTQIPLSSFSRHQRKTNPAICVDEMGQVVAKAKQGAEQATQKTDKDGKVVPKPSEAKELINFMAKNYETKVQSAKTFDEFYHAIYELIEMFCEERGQLQYKMPSKKRLEDAYKAVHPNGTANLSKTDFMKITESIITMDSFTFGKAALDVLVVLFGAPVCALLAKRIIPGLKSFSDDMVIPLATSGAVVYLAKTNKL